MQMLCTPYTTESFLCPCIAVWDHEKFAYAYITSCTRQAVPSTGFQGVRAMACLAESQSLDKNARS